MIIYTTKAININDSLYKRKSKQIFVVKYDTDNPSFVLPSPLTCFVHKYSSAYNTQKKYGDEVCQYLNYIIAKIAKHNNSKFERLSTEGLSGLDYYHLANYINYISTDLSNPITKQTAIYKQGFLFRFYNYLSESGINNKNDQIIKKIDLINSQYANKRRKRVTPFDLIHDITIKYPNDSNKPRPILKVSDGKLWEAITAF